MKYSSILAAVAAATACSASVLSARVATSNDLVERAPTPEAVTITPRVMIIDAFGPEGDSWYGIPQFDLLALNITVVGLSPLYPEVHCTSNGQICQVVTGESEINAASSITALYLSPHFNLAKTYFLVAGIAGINPEQATLGSVTFARYAVQVALQYEFDAREKPKNFTTGYFPQGAYAPNQYPESIYGTEVFEVNDALRHMAANFAKQAKLADGAAAVKYRAKYAGAPGGIYAAATKKPSVILCDSATSDVYFSGALLGQAFANYTTLVTNGTGVYCSTLQEDNAILEALIRAARGGLVDFSRIILMRTASDFDRPYTGESPEDNLLYADQGGFEIAIENIELAGVKIVEGIVNGWQATFQAGVTPKNYIGDILDSLPGAYPPDFGIASAYINKRTDLAGIGSMEGGRMVKRSVGKWRGPSMRLGE